MKWGDINLKKDSHDNEYLEYVERQTKTWTGSDLSAVRDVTPKAWAQADINTCPVAMYKKYRNFWPAGFSNPDDPFYLATNTTGQPRMGEAWFKRQPVGKNKLGGLMKNMCSRANLSTDKKITNHSARKHMIQTLSSQGVPPNQIMQISGHKNITSLNSYSRITNAQHQHIGQMLSGQQQSAIVSVTETSTAAQLNIPTQISSTATRTVTSQQTSFPINSIFAGPIHGGTFNIQITNAQRASDIEIDRSVKRRRIINAIDSDSE